MSTFRDRICWLHNNKQAPVTDTGPNFKDYGAVKEMPLSRIRIHSGVLSYDEPLIAADGAPISNTGYGSWGQLYAAGGRR